MDGKSTLSMVLIVQQFFCIGGWCFIDKQVFGVPSSILLLN